MTVLPGSSRDMPHQRYITAEDFAKVGRKRAANRLAVDWADKLETGEGRSSGIGTWEVVTPVSDWISCNFLVDRPRDPVTAAFLPPGPIIPAEYQTRILDVALERDGDGKFKYSTILWSEPKKSGKTTLAAAVSLWMAKHRKSAHIYCLANDGKQSQDRIFKAMADCVKLHNELGGCFQGVTPTWSPPTLKLKNGTVVEAIPCDAEGEAGSEPLMTVWSEMWGFRQDHKERLWTEMTIPPTLYGYALRWVESYAGYEDESTVLWNLYDNGVNHGVRHPLFPDLPVWENGGQLTFWSGDARMPWQTKEYYAEEAKLLLPNEFNRIHKNMWVSATTSFLPDMLLWDRCIGPEAGPLPAGDDTVCVGALDASVSGDSTALVVVSRHPGDTWDSDKRRVVVREAVAIYPPKGGRIDYSRDFEPVIKRIAERYNIFKWVYDPYQLHKLATDLRANDVGFFETFDQGGRRSRADKQLFDMIIQRHLIHNGDIELHAHIKNSAAKSEDTTKLRLVKKANGRPIDLAVALSMAVDEVLQLNV